jgi:hypothetical protein
VTATPSTNTPFTPVAVTPEGELASKKSLALKLNSEILELEADLGGNAYTLGVKLERVRNEKLYRLLGTKTFEGYVEKLGFARSTVARWRFVAAHFKEEDARNYGVEKLGPGGGRPASARSDRGRRSREGAARPVVGVLPAGGLGGRNDRARQGGQVFEQGPEAVDGLAVVGALAKSLRLG